MKPETYIVLPILVAENVENVYTVVEIPHLYRTTPAQMRVRVAKSSFAQGWEMPTIFVWRQAYLKSGNLNLGILYRQIRKVGNRAGIVFDATKYGCVPRWCIPNIHELIIMGSSWNCAIKLPSTPFSDTPTWKRVHLHFPTYSDMFYPIVCNYKPISYHNKCGACPIIHQAH